MTVTIVGPRRAEETSQPVAGALEVLSGAAVALGNRLDGDALLGELVTGVRRTLDADRVSLLLLDEAGRLIPTVAVARQDNDELWQRFRRMPPIAVSDLSGAREALDAGRVLLIEDACDSGLVPRPWQRAFGLGSLAIAPLQVGDSAAGILVVDQPGPPAGFSAEQVTLLEGMAALAAVALSGMRERGRVGRARHLAEWVSAIAGAATARSVAEHTLGGLLAVSGAAEGLLARVHGDNIDVLAVRGMGQPEPGRYPLSGVPTAVRESCAAAWTDGPRRPVTATVDGAPLTLLPVVGSRGVSGAAVLAVPAPGEAVAAQLGMLTDVAALAFRGTELAVEHDWRREGLRIARDLTCATGSDDGFKAALERLSGLLAGRGVTVSELVAADRVTARATALPRPDGELAEIVAGWRRSGRAAELAPCRGGHVLALTADRRVVGALLVGGADTTLLAEGSAVRVLADVLGQALAARVDAHRRVELERIAADAGAARDIAVRSYLEAGQILSRLLDPPRIASVPEARTVLAAQRVLLGQLRRLVRDAAEALSAPPARPGGLRAALKALAKRTEARTGTGVSIRTVGKLPALSPGTQVATLRAVHGLLAALRSTRATLICLNVESGPRTVSISLRADGLVHSTVDLDAVDLHETLRKARGWLTPVGGALVHSVDRGQLSFDLTIPNPSTPRVPQARREPPGRPAPAGNLTEPDDHRATIGRPGPAAEAHRAAPVR